MHADMLFSLHFGVVPAGNLCLFGCVVGMMSLQDDEDLSWLTQSTPDDHEREEGRQLWFPDLEEEDTAMFELPAGDSGHDNVRCTAAVLPADL